MPACRGAARPRSRRCARVRWPRASSSSRRCSRGVLSPGTVAKLCCGLMLVTVTVLPCLAECLHRRPDALGQLGVAIEERVITQPVVPLAQPIPPAAKPPQAHHVVVSAGRRVPAVRADRDAERRTPMTAPGPGDRARPRLPQPHSPVAPRAAQRRPGPTPGHGPDLRGLPPPGCALAI